MEAILGIIIFLIIILSFIKLRIGIAIYLAYLMLVPYMQIHFAGLTFSYNLVNLIILLAFFFEFKVKHNYKINFKPFIPFFILYAGYFILMLFSDGTPFDYMIEKFRQNIMQIFILAFVMWNVIVCTPSSTKLFRNVCFICIFIATIYGLFLTRMEGINPYIMSVMNITGNEYDIEYLTRDTGRMFGRIASVFLHPMTFGLYLGLSFIFICSYFKKKANTNIYILLILLVITLINVFTCGVRSVIAGLGITGLFYLLLLRKLKTFIWSAVFIGIIYCIISSIPELSDYVMSIGDTKSTNIGGSSLEMRINQFSGCFDIINNNLLSGKGFNWHSYYMQLHTSHPQLLYFESLIFVILCDFGLVGAILWIIYSYKMFHYTYNLGKLKQTLFPLSLFIFYLSYSCITGEYGYMQIFILFYIIMIGEIYVTQTSKSQ